MPRAACALALVAVFLTATPPPLTFEHVVTPFPVLDAAGRAYEMPFLGGLDVPRPQFVDIDDDGDLDLFLQEFTDQLWFFENTGTAKATRLVWRTNHYQNLEIGEWFRFVDLDGDGDTDLLTELPFSHVREYRNAGTKKSARYEFAGPLRDVDGAEISIDRQNIPAIVDIDCDGRLDLFVGRVEGIVARYEASAPGGDRFQLITERFEDIEIIGRGGPGPSMWHGANALAFADFDGDKDLDLFWGDFFEAGLLLIENVGSTCSSPSFHVEPVQLPFADSTRTSGYNIPVPVDLDLDGDLDFLMGVVGGAFNPVKTSADNFYFWEREAPDRFTLRSKRLLDGIDLGSETAPAVADLDGDGDLDLMVGNKIDPASSTTATLTVFENTGAKTAPAFRQRESLKLTDSFQQAPALGDLDGDGDPDLLLGTWNQDVLWFQNDGTRTTPRWVPVPARTIRLVRPSLSTPALGDVDGDGDLDLFVGQATGTVAFYRNVGTKRDARFQLVTAELEGVRTGRRSAPSLADVDGDGKLDLLIGREQGGVALFRNTGATGKLAFVEDKTFAVPLPPMSTPVLVDLTGDGVPDFLSGTTSGGLVFFRGSSRPATPSGSR